jgi:hypothetical protein
MAKSMISSTGSAMLYTDWGGFSFYRDRLLAQTTLWLPNPDVENPQNSLDSPLGFMNPLG